MKKFFNWLDPYHQSPLYFQWGFWSLLFVIGLGIWGFIHWDSPLMKSILDNIFVYLPNYLTHEMLGHNLIGQIGWRICSSACPAVGDLWMAAMGNGAETLLPVGLILLSLRLNGGRWLLPLLWYWLGTTLYAAGIYAADASACALKLTSSDMVTNISGGICTDAHDWHRILKGLHLLNYDTLIGDLFICLGVFSVVIALYSLYYYWTHSEQYLTEG